MNIDDIIDEMKLSLNVHSFQVSLLQTAGGVGCEQEYFYIHKFMEVRKGSQTLHCWDMDML